MKDITVIRLPDLKIFVFIGCLTLMTLLVNYGSFLSPTPPTRMAKSKK
jgi:hypothetical protein